MASASVSAAVAQRRPRPHLRTLPAEPDAARRCSEIAEAPGATARGAAAESSRGGAREPRSLNLRLDGPTVRTRVSIGWPWRGAGLAEAEPVVGARIGALAELDPPPWESAEGRGWGVKERRWEVAGCGGRRWKEREEGASPRKGETMTRGNNLETRARTACPDPAKT